MPGFQKLAYGSPSVASTGFTRTAGLEDLEDKPYSEAIASEGRLGFCQGHASIKPNSSSTVKVYGLAPGSTATRPKPQRTPRDQLAASQSKLSAVCSYGSQQACNPFVSPAAPRAAQRVAKGESW